MKQLGGNLYLPLESLRTLEEGLLGLWCLCFEGLCSRYLMMREYCPAWIWFSEAWLSLLFLAPAAIDCIS